MSGLCTGYLHDVLVSFSHDFPNKEIRSIRVTDYNVVRVTYVDDGDILASAEYRYSLDFTATLQR